MLAKNILEGGEKVNKRAWFSLCILLVIVMTSGCEEYGTEKNPDKLVEVKEFIEDISYNSKEENPLNYTIYLEENGQYIPYIVVTSEYSGSGKVLLVRENVLDARMKFNDNGPKTGYYENSYVDTYLSDEFIQRFESNVVESMVSSEISIVSIESLGRNGNDMIKITRTIFLLGYSEVIETDLTHRADDGPTLDYFINLESLTAYSESGEKHSWWLRTSNSWYDMSAYAIGYKGTYGGAAVEGPNGVRPAFCLEKGLEIERIEGIIVDQDVFVLKQ